MISRSRLAIAFGVVTMVLGGAAVAWACTAASNVSGVFPSSGPAGTAVTVTGEGYSAGGPVEIRWGSETGLELATATGPNFAATVTIPGARAGSYALVVIDKTTGQTRSGFFTLTAPAAENPVEAPEQNPVEAPEQNPAETPAPVDWAPGTDSAPSVGTPVAADAPAAGAPAPLVRPRADVPARAATSPSAPAPAPQATAAPAVADEPALSVDELSESALSVNGDLWSGFASGTDSSAGASLVDTAERSSSNSPALAIGIALLATGLVALFGGFATAAVTRRRRARAELS